MEIVVLDKVNTLAVPVSSLLDTVDWASGPLGPKSEWPACLHAAIGIMLPSHAQIVMFWGPEFVAFYNDAYAPTIGNKHPHAFGRPAREYWNELWDDLEPLLQRVLAKGETVAAKDRPFYIERHGYPETVYFDISYSPVADQDGTVRGVFCIVNETTERVKADAALRESEERLRAIFAQSAAGIALGDLTGKLLSVNDHFCRIVGRPRDELIGIRMQEITFADDLPENQRLFQHMVQTGESFEIEKRYVRGDGSLVWVANSVSAIRDDGGNMSQAVAISVDIGERRHAQEIEKHLASMIASSNDAIMGIDLDMKITSWNAAAEKLYGYSQDEVVGRSVLMLVPDGRQEEEPRILTEVRAGRFVEPYETQRRRKDGRLVEVLLSVSPIRDANGRVIGASKTAHDITARKDAERLKSILVNELHHRVKNVLATVTAIARQTLGRDKANHEEVEAFTSRLASLSRAQDLLVHADWQHADLKAVMQQALSPYPVDAFQIGGPSVPLPPRAVVSLSLALHELATNAAKYGALSAPGGQVSISWQFEPLADNRLRIVWEERGGPEVARPRRRGFGSTLIERLLSAELKGETKFVYEKSGVICVIEAEMSKDDDGAA
ncbi:PAS domain-containing sensor histidine kinase [Agrobacterium pusense]|uniref:Blue-light-activated histidine kinase n=1 Tax=Agrobacterium pusense TaxID=648995 RepID=A0AA44IYS1_9HYPH|nr:PAS domain S-box protein [Agrobacterium pusense]MBW9078843.1 PAS domain S-box protein [Agrobacterium pusense]MDR6191346.1 PAS domain S-box-containing protein [Agrobacterium pusense]NRF09541.1 PAS domain S-box protein [Agrobacterium pusense]NRF19554.1 PAS domain S-box protein [Agrobacterium pusense]WFN88241.1 PAS domain S-box protein [Agrobacterium pusense]